MFTLKIKTDNAAFDDTAQEIARILRDTADRLERGGEFGTLRDINGNTVGEFVAFEGDFRPRRDGE
jgi:hypothetical protein